MENRETEIRDILQRDTIMYVYNMLRLIIVMMLLAYGFGCLNYFVSDVANSEEARKEKKTMTTFFEWDEHQDTDLLVINFYFALTTLSTVGYGDYYPISLIERLVSITM